MTKSGKMANMTMLSKQNLNLGVSMVTFRGYQKHNYQSKLATKKKQSLDWTHAGRPGSVNHSKTQLVLCLFFSGFLVAEFLLFLVFF